MFYCCIIITSFLCYAITLYFYCVILLLCYDCANLVFIKKENRMAIKSINVSEASTVTATVEKEIDMEAAMNSRGRKPKLSKDKAVTLTVTIPFSLMGQLDDFQFENRIRSRSQLVKMALEAYLSK